MYPRLSEWQPPVQQVSKMWSSMWQPFGFNDCPDYISRCLFMKRIFFLYVFLSQILMKCVCMARLRQNTNRTLNSQKYAIYVNLTGELQGIICGDSGKIDSVITALHCILYIIYLYVVRLPSQTALYRESICIHTGCCETAWALDLPASFKCPSPNLHKNSYSLKNMEIRQYTNSKLNSWDAEIRLWSQH